jgi:nucleotide-binding universal stress UspA family protein
MFRRILVPLDGSKLAECALAPALRLAEQFGSEVMLLRVVVPEDVQLAHPIPARTASNYFVSPAATGDPSEADWEAEAYLAELCERQAGSRVRFRAEVVAGTLPEVIVAAAEASAVDLIVMSTHGRSGLSRLIYGSVAEAVIRGAHRLVMIVPSAQQFTDIP